MYLTQLSLEAWRRLHLHLDGRGSSNTTMHIDERGVRLKHLPSLRHCFKEDIFATYL